MLIPKNSKLLIGMVHAGALPGTPFARHSISDIVRQAVAEARTLIESGFDGVIVENMHDRPYINGPHGAEVVAPMTHICLAVREAIKDKVLGVQILSRGEKEALAIAHTCNAQFIRCENFVFSHVADEGLMPDAAAGPLLRYRRQIGADHIEVFADIKKKHASHALTADLSLADAAKGAEFFGANGLIVTGTATGQPVDPAHLAEVRAATSLPVLVGSGVTVAQVRSLFQQADALIVGSSVKQGGLWTSPVDPARCRALAQARDQS